MVRRYSYVCLSVRLPRQRVWPILPGARSFLNCSGCWCQSKVDSSLQYIRRAAHTFWGISRARSGMCRSPMTSIKKAMVVRGVYSYRLGLTMVMESQRRRVGHWLGCREVGGCAGGSRGRLGGRGPDTVPLRRTSDIDTLSGRLSSRRSMVGRVAVPAGDVISCGSPGR